VLEEASFSDIEQDKMELSKFGEIKVVVNRVSRSAVGLANRNAAKKPQGKDAPSMNFQPKDRQIPANINEKAMKGDVKSHGIT
jgi:hypothetical protein